MTKAWFRMTFLTEFQQLLYPLCFFTFLLVLFYGPWDRLSGRLGTGDCEGGCLAGRFRIFSLSKL